MATVSWRDQRSEARYVNNSGPRRTGRAGKKHATTADDEATGSNEDECAVLGNPDPAPDKADTGVGDALDANDVGDTFEANTDIERAHRAPQPTNQLPNSCPERAEKAGASRP
jgi:hypothetical protein